MHPRGERRVSLAMLRSLPRCVVHFLLSIFVLVFLCLVHVLSLSLSLSLSYLCCVCPVDLLLVGGWRDQSHRVGASPRASVV